MAVPLSAMFKHVVAQDRSAQQLGHAPQHDNITYEQADALETKRADASVDFVTIAQVRVLRHPNLPICQSVKLSDFLTVGRSLAGS
jgi:hypothetical protein